MIDSHAHINFASFKDDAEEVIQRALKKKIAMINVGSQFSTSERAVMYAEKYDFLYAAIGLHPVHLEERKIKEEVTPGEFVGFNSAAEKFDPDLYFDLFKLSDKVVAIGEAGLDYYHLEPEELEEQKELQVKVLKQHITLANELKLPMIIHCRDAYDDLIGVLEKKKLKHGGVVHFFNGSWEQAQKFLDFGLYLGFTGVITFKNATPKLLEVVKKMPEDRILSETDCPYLSPEPHRGKRNEPAYVEYVVKKIAELRGWSMDHAIATTEDNAMRLFNIDF